MKTFTLTIIILLFNVNGFSQIKWSRVIDFDGMNKSYTTGCEMLGDSLVVQIGYVSKNSCRKNAIFTYDLEGNLLWYYKNNQSIVGGKFEVIATSEEFIYTAGQLLEDDYFDPTLPLIIAKFDKEGNTIFETWNLTDEDSPYEFIPEHIDTYNDEKILLSAKGYYPVKSNILMANENGEMIWLKDYNFTINDIKFINSERFIISTANRIHLANSNGSILITKTVDGWSKEIVVFEDLIFQLFENKIIVWDTDLQQIETINAPSQIILNKLKVFENKVWVMGIISDSVGLAYIEDYEITEFSEFDLYVNSPDFLISKSSYLFTGNSPSEQIAIYSYDKNEQDFSYNWLDIEIIDFSINNIRLNYNPDVGFYTSYYFDAHITIRNNSSNPIDSLAIFSNLDFGYNCWSQHYYKKYTGINLLPGTEKTLSAYNIHEEKYPTNNNKLCFEVLSPNSEIELSIENNVSCKFFDVLNIQENNAENIRVFPNPVENLLTIELEEEAKYRIRLININGETVFEEITNSKNYSIDMTSYTNGLYILSINSGSIILTTKIIKL